MYTQSGQYRGIDYHVKAYPGDGITGWVAALSKDGRPIKEVSGSVNEVNGNLRSENVPVWLAVECEIDAEFEMAASGQSLWGLTFS
jgi:hypothetical protein